MFFFSIFIYIATEKLPIDRARTSGCENITQFADREHPMRNSKILSAIIAFEHISFVWKEQNVKGNSNNEKETIEVNNHKSPLI